MEPIIKIKKMDVRYFIGRTNEVHALKDINLEIYPGEFIIFFGPSGCGKSTLLYSITGLETNTTGDIYFNDKNIAKFNSKELGHFHQRQTGMIFQAYYLISSISVLKNVILPQIAIGEKKNKRKKKALGLLKHFDVSEQANKLPNELSGGQQQRVAICRSLINEPDVLFADEPVGNLDSKSATEVLALLKELNEKEKKTIVLVTHNPAYLDIAHRVFYMKDGAIMKTVVNKKVGDSAVSSREKAEKLSLSKELELLARSFSGISGSVGNLLTHFKAKQITTEVLVGMTEDEISKIENKVESLLTKGIQGDEMMFKYLDDEIEKGGMGMDRRTAQRLAEQIKKIVKEIKILEEEENKLSSGQNTNVGEKVIQVRRYLLDAFPVQVKEFFLLERIDKAIEKRLENKIDKKVFQKIMDLPVEKGGIGLDKRTARKIAKRLELLILGKYKQK